MVRNEPMKMLQGNRTFFDLFKKKKAGVLSQPATKITNETTKKFDLQVTTLVISDT